MMRNNVLQAAKRLKAKFAPIPAEKWTVGRFSDMDNSRHCSVGMCITNTANPSIQDRVDIRVAFAGHSVTPSMFHLRINITKSTEVAIMINDKFTVEYQQPTPKERIIAALDDIIRNNTPILNKYPDITPELAVLPISETSDLVTTKTKEYAS